MAEGIRITMVPDGPGRARIMALAADEDGVLAGTAKSISAGFWEASLRRASGLSGPQGPREGRGPMEHGKEALRVMLERWANEHGPWWPREMTG
jgi:hypothetical protein